MGRSRQIGQCFCRSVFGFVPHVPRDRAYVEPGQTSSSLVVLEFKDNNSSHGGHSGTRYNLFRKDSPGRFYPQGWILRVPFHAWRVAMWNERQNDRTCEPEKAKNEENDSVCHIIALRNSILWRCAREDVLCRSRPFFLFEFFRLKTCCKHVHLVKI